MTAPPPGPPSGAGSSLAGYTPAGVDTYLPGSGSSAVFSIPPGLPPLPPAVNYDASIKAYTQNPDGTFLPVHPVDQTMQQLLTIPRGTVPAQPDVGQRYARRLLGVPAAQQQSVAADETRVACAGPLSRGDVSITSVTVFPASSAGSSWVQVVYKNLRLPPGGRFAQPQPVVVPLNTG